MDIRDIKEFHEQDALLKLVCLSYEEPLTKAVLNCTKSTEFTLLTNLVERSFFEFKDYYFRTQPEFWLVLVSHWANQLLALLSFGGHDCLALGSGVADYYLQKQILEYYWLIFHRRVDSGLSRKKAFWTRLAYEIPLLWDVLNNGFYCLTGGWPAVQSWDTANWPWKNLSNASFSNFDVSNPPHWFYIISFGLITYYTSYFGTVDMLTLYINLPRSVVFMWKVICKILLVVF